MRHPAITFSQEKAVGGGRFYFLLWFVAFFLLFIFLCQAGAATSAACERKRCERWQASALTLCGQRQHHCAARGKHPEAHVCSCRAAPQQAPVLEIFTESFLSNSPDLAVRRRGRNSLMYLVHSSLTHGDCRCGCKHQPNIQTGSKEH